MRYPRVSFIGAALPVAAILSLACGPSPSAAHAKANKARTDTHATKRTAEGCGNNAPSPLAPKPPAPTKPRKPNTNGTFVAPSSAKPSEGKAGGLALTLAAGNGPASPVRALPGPVIGDRPAPRPSLHRATYLALAPPSA